MMRLSVSVLLELVVCMAALQRKKFQLVSSTTIAMLCYSVRGVGSQCAVVRSIVVMNAKNAVMGD